jgi:hypothetical protein
MIINHNNKRYLELPFQVGEKSISVQQQIGT